jgi:nitric oxide reductase subunit C
VSPSDAVNALMACQPDASVQAPKPPGTAAAALFLAVSLNIRLELSGILDLLQGRCGDAFLRYAGYHQAREIPMSTATSGFTKEMARNIFYGGSLFFILVFVGLVFHTEREIPARSNQAALTESVVRGKAVWEQNNCVGCHSLLGEGAYFAPELGNVYQRRGGDASGGAFIKAWMKSQPTGTPGRRQMPQFNLSDQQLDDLVEFLKWSNGINTEKWPPNIEG